MNVSKLESKPESKQYIFQESLRGGVVFCLICFWGSAMRLFCVLLFMWVNYTFAETYAELQEQILELEIEILENENNPEKLHSVELMKRKQAMFKPTSPQKILN